MSDEESVCSSDSIEHIEGKAPKTYLVDRNGTVWRVGARVTTASPLAAGTKEEFEAGLKGCIWGVDEANGLLQVVLDKRPREQPKGKYKMLVLMAEPCDLILDPLLAERTRVRCRPVSLRCEGHLRTIPAGAQGQIVAVHPDAGVYEVRIPSLRLIAELSVNTVYPAPACSFSKLLTPALTPLRMLRQRSSGTTAPSTPLSDSDVSHLAKVPEYSSIAGSPSARQNRRRAGTSVDFTHGI